MHRHLRERWVELPEAAALMAKHGDAWAVQGPFKFCPICKCVPTGFTGPGEAPERPLTIGDRCQLNSGGHVCLVVHEDDDDVTIAWLHEGEAKEAILPRVCVKRVPL